MKGRPSLPLVGVTSLLFLVLSVNAHVKLNVPRVRLPYFEGLSVNFTLKVETPGCYSWSISRTDVVTLTTSSSPETFYDQEGCSDSALISTVPRVSGCCPASAIVFAEDVLTKEIVRCDVIVDKISAIQILTTTKELHLEEAPSKFHILGYGSKDNELSTLDGVPFSWVLESAKNKESSTIIDPQSIMRFIPFSESPYKATPGVALLETKHMQGDTVLLEGIKTGSAEVIARISDPSYKGMEARVRIIVVASLLLEPSEVWVVPGTVLPITLLQIKHGRKFEIRLPSSVYVFNIENESAASYDRESSKVTALEYGDAKIIVKDKNWVDELEEHSEALTSKIHVTEPKYLSLSIYPYKNWALVMGNLYEVQVDVYNVENQKLYIGDNLFIETKFDPAYFRVNYSSPNGTYHTGVPIKLGSSYVTAELQKIVLPDGSETTPSPRPRVKTEMEIFQNIAINPKETILPWDPNVMPKYDLRWNPSGGNGNYMWTSSNTSVVTVSQSATGRTEGFGSANVTVSATVNSYMKNTARVYVLPPTKMEIVEHIVEAEIGTAIQVPLAFYTIRPNDPNRTQVPYSSCSQLPIHVYVEDPNFVYDDKTHYPNLKPACVVLPIMGNALGSSKVTATYSVGDKYFEDSVIVSTFKPLNTLEPENEMVVLAVGSSKQLVFEGGPRPLLETKQSGFQKYLEITNGTVASQRGIKLASGLKDDIYVFEVVCKEIGETDAIFRIGNTKVSEQSQPIIRIKIVQVICSEPYQMYFKVESSTKSKCPNDGSSAQIVRVAVPNYEPTLVSVVVKDKEGRKFDNITSLRIDWVSQPEYIDFATQTFAVTEPIITSLGYIDTGKGLQTIRPSRVTGNVEIIAKVKGYRDEVLTSYGLSPRKLLASTDDELSELEHSMDITLVSAVTISPSASVTLFNHPSSSKTLKINDGSGYFELDTKDSNKINVSYDDTTKTIKIRPLVQGKATIILRDLCVPTKKEAIIEVDVTGIGSIDVVADDKIAVDEQKMLTVSLHDQNGRLLPPETVQLVHLSLKPMTFDILEVTPVLSDKEFKKQPSPKIQFKIVGKRVGVAKVGFSAEDGNISSSSKAIDVFAPLRLSPKEVTILPGNIVSFTANGGPNDADIVFEMSKEAKHVAAIQLGELSTGRIKALGLGRTTIYGRAVDPVTRKVYSEDFAEVKVVTLTSLRIITPLTVLFEDEKMPVWFTGVSGKAEISSDLLVSATPVLSNVEWIVSNSEHAEITEIFVNDMGSSIGRDLRTQFHALKTGNITLHVRAYYQGTVLTSQKLEIDIRQYPYGHTGEEPGVRLISGVKLVLEGAYYWLFLPFLVAIAILIGSVAYNSFVYGDLGSKKTQVDTALFISSPAFSTPQQYTPTKRTSTPLSYSQSPTRSGSPPSPQHGQGDSLSPNHRRLYSTFGAER